MENRIINEGRTDLPASLVRLLPSSVHQSLEGMGDIEELRLAAGKPCWVRKNGKNLPLALSLTREAFDELLDLLCGGSFYAHAETIKEGFLSLDGGVRVGLCGRAVTEGGQVTGLSQITSLCIRIPHTVSVDVSVAEALLSRFSYTRGILLYAPPDGGKTTYLGSLAARLASGKHPRRVAVVDTRDELSYFLRAPSLCLDILSGYPKGYGVEVATRVLGAQIIICDEIGSAEDAAAILGVQSGGVPLVASAHAASLSELLGRGTLLSLHKAGVFGAYLGLSGTGEPLVTLAEDANALV